MAVPESEVAAADAAFDAWRRRHRPANEIPASIALDVVIGASDGLVVFVSSLAVYRNGISFVTEARARGGPGSADKPVQLLEGLSGSAPRHQGMLLGLEFADGRRCIATPRGREAKPTDEPLLLPGAGEGGNGVASVEWFLSPLPPPGDVRLYCAWPSAGIPETATVIDADQLREAVRRVQHLWPSPRVHDQQPHPTPVALPSDGWFGNAGLK